MALAVCRREATLSLLCYGAYTLLRAHQVIFKEAAARGTLSKYLSLFPGLGFGAGYKILQRVYKFGGQVGAKLHLFVRLALTRRVISSSWFLLLRPGNLCVPP